MRTEEEMFQLIMDVAKQEEHIRAVGMVGSRTNVISGLSVGCVFLPVKISRPKIKRIQKPKLTMDKLVIFNQCMKHPSL